CRFRSGQVCGPALELAGRVGPAEYEERTRFGLPTAPADMVLGPDDALWLTLPDSGLLARIALSPDEAEPFGRAADGQAQQLSPYRVPLPLSQEAPMPVAEQHEY